jgi:lipid-A-disaccharide synthase
LTVECGMTSASSSQPLRIVMVACEASGDLLGSSLIAALKRQRPDAQIEGIGGEGMRAAGMTLWHDYSELSVMGLVEVLRHLPRLLKLRKAALERAVAARPSVYIGIDGPDFNLGIERKLKAQGIRTVHYVSPSIWAWREGRAKKIQRSADRVLCLFPMEPPIYARYSADARFVGHPLADQFDIVPDRQAARTALGIPSDAPVLAVLPGSRLGEIFRLGTVFLLAAVRLRRKFPDLQLVSPMANAKCREAFTSLLSAEPPRIEGDDTAATQAEWSALRDALTLTDGQAHQVMIASDQILLASGTAALEAMLAKRPMVVAYKIAPLTAMIVRGLGMMKVDRYSLPNVLAGEPIVPELMQEDCTPAKIAATMTGLIESPATTHSLIPRFEAIHNQLRLNAAESAARAVLELVDAPR